MGGCGDRRETIAAMLSGMPSMEENWGARQKEFMDGPGVLVLVLVLVSVSGRWCCCFSFVVLLLVRQVRRLILKIHLALQNLCDVAEQF